MTVKKNPTAEQLNEFRKLIGLASSDADLDNINAFIEEYDLSTQIFEENGKKGVKDAAGEVLIPAIYDEVCYTFMDFCTPFAVPVIKDGKFAFAAHNGEGTLVSDFEYDDIVYTPECCYVIVKDGKKGLAGEDGKVMIPAEMDEIYSPFNGLAAYEKDGKYGFSMVYESLMTEAVYDSHELGEDDYLEVVKDGVKGYIDAQGQFTTDEDERYFSAYCN